jgi:hypothetical protein
MDPTHVQPYPVALACEVVQCIQGSSSHREAFTNIIKDSNVNMWFKEKNKVIQLKELQLLHYMHTQWDLCFHMLSWLLELCPVSSIAILEPLLSKTNFHSRQSTISLHSHSIKKWQSTGSRLMNGKVCKTVILSVSPELALTLYFNRTITSRFPTKYSNSCLKSPHQFCRAPFHHLRCSCHSGRSSPQRTSTYNPSSNLASTQHTPTIIGWITHHPMSLQCIHGLTFISSQLIIIHPSSQPHDPDELDSNTLGTPLHQVG